MSEVLVSMKNIQKYFPGVHALDDIQLEIRAGEALALVGENGAGKSTLMKILAGIYQKDSGSICYKGKEVEINSPTDAQNLGIGIIHQELNLMPHLTVAQNIWIGREPMNGPFLDAKRLQKDTEELLASLGIDNINPTDKVSSLTVAKQQMIEIAKALSHSSEVLVMDEPSAALTDREIVELFKFIRKLKGEGKGIVYISHRMDELEQITDRVTVMRDGQYVDTVMTADTTVDDIIHMMVGRTIYEEPKSKSNVPEDAPVVLEVKNLNSKDVIDVSFNLKKGEILGFAGLVGAGRTEVMRLLFGADKMDSGEVYINGEKVDIKSPQDAVGHSLAYLSEDRKRFGLATGLNVADNSVFSCLENYTSLGFINDPKVGAVAQEFVDKLNTKTPTVKQLIKNLSGGNQQKVVIAKWLIKNCKILIFDEPTRGIDVGAKSEIYKLMNALAAQGDSIIMISSELPELLRMSDRVVVMCEGRITGELPIETADQKGIMKLATAR